MKTCIALFRGINVGGKNMLPMKELVTVLESIGLQNIKTYIQSGNAVFQSKTADTAKLAKTISAAIKESHGFEPQVLLLDSVALEEAIKANPYPEAEAAPNTLYVVFLAAIPPKPDLDALERIRAASERFQLAGNVLYLHAPDGVGRSKLAAGMERLLGVAMTSRNWNTVRKLQEMITKQ
ncbi:MAG: DUF1697 domain-containing protein [Gallionella sp.]|nr:DUF1697 domain-containing protein [Gallionella sp.]